MSMKVTRVKTHWSPKQASIAIELLDTLRDALWEDYGDQISELFWHDIASTEPCVDEAQQALPFDDDIPF